MSQYFFDKALNVCIYAYIVKAINHYGKKPFCILPCAAMVLNALMKVLRIYLWDWIVNAFIWFSGHLCEPVELVSTDNHEE